MCRSSQYSKTTYVCVTLFFVVIFSTISGRVMAREKVVLQLKWLHQFQFAGYYMAREKGYFEQAGFDVEIRSRDLASSPVDDVLSGKAQFGVADSSIVLSRLNGKPVVVVTTIFQTSPLVFMALKSSGITSPYDLAGKRVMSQRNVDDASLLALLSLVNLSSEDYDHIPHNFDNWALTADTTDVMSAYLTDQPFHYKQQDIEVNIIDPASYGIDFYGDLLFTTEEYIKKHPDKVTRFSQAVRKGWDYALNNRQETIAVILNKYNPDLSLEALHYEAKLTKSITKHGIVDIGTVSAKRFTRIANTYQDLGMAPSTEQIQGLLLSDYQEHPFTLDPRIIYVSGVGFILILGFTLTQIVFNRRLKRTVADKTRELECTNDKLQQNLEVMARQNAELEDARKNAEAANRSKSAFLANMSHEIRTPMNSIFGSLQLLKTATGRHASELTTNAIHSTRTLLTIINDILDFTKIEAGKLDLELTAFGFDPLLQIVIAELQPNAEEKSVTIEFEYQTGYQEGWLGDPVRVRQILLNIVSNGVKFTRQGRVTVTVSSEHPQFGKGLVFQVNDSGIGMTEEGVSKLFSRFEQADNTTTREFGGTGLGMAISNHLVTIMGGSIEVSSELNQGSRFEVFLPLKSVKMDSVTPKQITETLTIPELQRKTILVAEDNEINQVIIESMLGQTGAHIILTTNGQQAVEETQRIQPDLILMDIQMPVMDGVEACKQIKSEYENIPIIALTANVFKEDIEHYKTSGFDSHIAKPIEMDELFAQLQHYLAQAN